MKMKTMFSNAEGQEKIIHVKYADDFDCWTRHLSCIDSIERLSPSRIKSRWSQFNYSLQNIILLCVLTTFYMLYTYRNFDVPVVHAILWHTFSLVANGSNGDSPCWLQASRTILLLTFNPVANNSSNADSQYYLHSSWIILLRTFNLVVTNESRGKNLFTLSLINHKIWSTCNKCFKIRMNIFK